jgi:hypothetical protein
MSENSTEIQIYGDYAFTAGTYPCSSQKVGGAAGGGAAGGEGGGGGGGIRILYCNRRVHPKRRAQQAS